MQEWLVSLPKQILWKLSFFFFFFFAYESKGNLIRKIETTSLPTLIIKMKNFGPHANIELRESNIGSSRWLASLRLHISRALHLTGRSLPVPGVGADLPHAWAVPCAQKVKDTSLQNQDLWTSGSTGLELREWHKCSALKGFVCVCVYICISLHREEKEHTSFPRV